MRTPKNATISLAREPSMGRLSTKNNSKNSVSTSLTHSSCSSLANISIGFKNNRDCPKLFKDDQSLLFSFNPVSTTKSSVSKGKPQFSSSMSFSSAKSSELTTAFNSFHAMEDRQTLAPFKKNKMRSDFQSTPKQNTIKINKKSAESILPGDLKKEDKIQVFIRIKPNTDGRNHLLEKPYLYRVDEKHLEVDGKVMAYDNIFPTQSKQIQIFQKVAQPVVDNVLNGFNGTIFAYGQTGSGKTHTIFGGNTEESYGLIYRSVYRIFQKKNQNTQVTISLMEIYREELIDLLSSTKNQLKLKENGGSVVVQGLTNIHIREPEEALAYINHAEKNRRTATTLLNEKSSRSHTFLTLNILTASGQSKLCLIDLAGSEKVNKAGVSGETLEETKKINFSLSCLGNVINALVTRKKSDHIPFRDSKLTRLLKDSLTGKFMTSLIVNCASDQGTEEESITSLKFADRAKKVKVTISRSNGNKANLEYYQGIIKKLSDELETTKKELCKYKQIYTKQTSNQRRQSPEITACQTIPSERVHVDQRMKKYGKQNKLLTVVSQRPGELDVKGQKREQSNILDLSSLNVSRSVANFFGEMNSPTLSSLTNRNEEIGQDFSLNLSLQKDTQRSEFQV